MITSRYVRALFSSWRLLVMAAFFGTLLSVLFSLTQPLQYSSAVRLLITQANATGLDPYTAIKSTERIATSLSELLYTSTFADNIIKQAPGFQASYFPADEYSKRREWRKAIETSVAAGTGIMTVTAYHPRKDQARALVDAAAKEIALQAPNYFGYNVRVQVIDSPLDSRWFARPHFASNAIFGLMVGTMLGLAWVLARHPSRM